MIAKRLLAQLSWLPCASWCVFAWCLWGSPVFAQSTERLMKAANTLFDAQDYPHAIELYKDVLIQDNAAVAKQRLAECYRLTGDLTQAEYWYKKLMEQQPEIAEHKLIYAQILQGNGKYEEAKKWFLEYAKYDIWGEKLAKSCDAAWIAQHSKNMQHYQLFLLPFNTAVAEFGLTAVGQRLLYCSNAAGGGSSALSGSLLDMFWVDRQLNFLFDVPQRIKGKINSEYNDGPASFSMVDSVLYFSRNSATNGGRKIKSSDGKVRLSIFSSRWLADGKWSDLTAFEHNNTEYSVSHPAISADGQTLYFASDMPGGLGGLDLYFCTRIDSLWSRPINLGLVINSPGNEMSPFVAADGGLYFSSNGLAGFGGYDVFRSERKANQWATPTNMGAPLNSTADDFGFWIDGSQQYGFFASNRSGGVGNDDLYRFMVEGYYEQPPADTTQQDTTALSAAAQAPFTIDKAEIDNPILNTRLGMNKISFKAGDWTLTPAAEAELDKVIDFLRRNPAVTVELGSHTDARGDDFVNYETSINRADAARQYIFLHDIPATQVQAKGYGENDILNGCYNTVACTADQHEQNNRLNVKAIAYAGKPIRATLPPPYELLLPSPTPPSSPSTDTLGTALPSDSLLTTTPPINPIDTLPPMQFRVHIGPYKNMDNNVYYSYAEIGTAIDQINTDKGTFIRLGPYPTITEAEMYDSYAKKIGGKTKVIGYTIANDTESLLNVKKLRKLGYQ